MKNERIDCVILGRVIGTHTGWDQCDTFTIQIYDFEPIAGVDIPAKDCVTFSLETGLGTWFEEGVNENIEHNFDFVSKIIHIELKFNEIEKYPIFHKAIEEREFGQRSSNEDWPTGDDH